MSITPMESLVNYDAVVLPTSTQQRIQHPARLDYYQRLTEDGAYNLTEPERYWRDHYKLFLSHGYQLRPRYHPGWKPSWIGTNIHPPACEDAYENLETRVIDAKRMYDGKIVAIKQVVSDSLEVRIGRMLSSRERLDVPTNHCVPILDCFQDDRDKRFGFIVMPILRRFNDPSFSYVGEVIDFMRQTLEGLDYIHSQNIAHRNCSDGNIMMEARGLFSPDGFHPSLQSRSARDISLAAVPRKRIEVEPVKYYFTDFGLSSYFPEGAPRLVTGARAEARDAPELSNTRPYNPFYVDVFTLGMVYKRNLLDVYTDFNFLSPLVDAMTRCVPSERITAAAALRQFERLVTGLRGHILRSRVHGVGEGITPGVFGDVQSAFERFHIS